MKRYNCSPDDILNHNSSNSTGEYSKPPVCFKTQIIVPDKVAYLYVNSFNALSVNSDRDGIYKFLKEIKDYPNLIIDIRGNGGGSENYWMQNIVSPLLNEKITTINYMLFRGGEYNKKFYDARYAFERHQYT
ncbi:peptidase family S41 [Clostridium tepidiprofundi DSM 19306]|uniref:Peptidase family S41 n=1 Tax=Clostridium tepidiprofundi DSM 19306 TaxID=1121338 RepID=A0A151AQ54_9CLOT|nr:S41 family peptidase [Clostridium tepidiprofundi]KYH29723.1 peptidase family S41 [Clostridium tepidiprofundi DSM 19306]